MQKSKSTDLFLINNIILILKKFNNNKLNLKVGENNKYIYLNMINFLNHILEKL